MNQAKNPEWQAGWVDIAVEQCVRPLKVKFSVKVLLRCIFKAQFINSANALLLTAVAGSLLDHDKH